MEIDQSWRPVWYDMNLGVYPDHGDDLDAWAWEYLRRNPEYQADYARWAALPDDGDGGKSAKYELTVGDWVGMKFCAELPGVLANPGETAGEYERRTGQWVDTLYRAFGAKWRADPAAPSSETTPLWEISTPPYSLSPLDGVFTENQPMLRGRNLFSAGWGEDDNPYIEAIGFDLRYKIDDQWTQIRADLLELQTRKDAAEQARLYPGSFPAPAPIKVANRNVVSKMGDHETHLRYLDAVAAGASHTEIANKLYEGMAKRDKGDDEDARHKKAAESWLNRLKKEANERMTRKYRNMVFFHMLAKAEK